MQEAHISGPKESNVLGATLLHCNKLLQHIQASDILAMLLQMSTGKGADRQVVYVSWGPRTLLEHSFSPSRTKHN